jgi:hypothetical protein
MAGQVNTEMPPSWHRVVLNAPPNTRLPLLGMRVDVKSEGASGMRLFRLTQKIGEDFREFLAIFSFFRPYTSGLKTLGMSISRSITRGRPCLIFYFISYLICYLICCSISCETSWLLVWISLAQLAAQFAAQFAARFPAQFPMRPPAN